MIHLLKTIVNVMKDPAERLGREISINMVIKAICKRNAVVSPDGEPPANVKQGIFSLLGFMTMLFEIPRNFSTAELYLSKPMDPLILYTRKPLDDTRFLLGVLIASFGAFIPRIRKVNWPPTQPDSINLHTFDLERLRSYKDWEVENPMVRALFSTHLMKDSVRLIGGRIRQEERGLL